MATISFAPSTNEAPASPVIENKQVEEKTVAVVESQPLAVAPAGPIGIEGEISADDIKPPRLNLVQKVGNLGDEFTPGSFVYDKTFPIVGPGKEMNVTVLRFKKYYQQKVAFGSDTLPQRFDRAEDVRVAGGTTRWSEEAIAAGQFYAETADILLAIEAPAELDADQVSTFFPYVQSEKSYGLLVYTITSSAFTSFGRRIITDGTMLLRDGLYTGQYKLKSAKQTNAQNSWFAPSASFDKKHTPEDAAFFRSIARL